MNCRLLSVEKLGLAQVLRVPGRAQGQLVLPRLLWPRDRTSITSHSFQEHTFPFLISSGVAGGALAHRHSVVTQSSSLGPCSWKAKGSEIYLTLCCRAVARTTRLPCRVITGAWILGTPSGLWLVLLNTWALW